MSETILQLPLDEAVHSYATRVAAAPAIREEVAVSVERTDGFGNRARAASGHVTTLDEPVSFGGGGTAPDPAEALLAAAGASLSVTITAHAALRGLTIGSITADLSAWMSAASFFQPQGDAPAGIQDAEIRLTLRSREAPAKVRALVRDSVRASPVLRSLRRRPRVILTIEGQL